MPKRRQPELVLPWHEPQPLSKAACKRGWRFTEKLFSGRGFAATRIAGRCFGFACAAIAGSGIAAQSAAAKRGAGNIAQPTGVISRASRGGWIIATASAPIVAGESTGRVTDQGSQSASSPSPSEGGKAITTPAVARLRVRPCERRGFWLRCMVCGRTGRLIDPFPRTSIRR